MIGSYSCAKTRMKASDQEVNSFHDLAVWQKGMEMTKAIYQTTQHFPKREMYGMSDQLRRASVSVPANISEGWGRNTPRSYVHFLQVAKGSVSEVETIFLIAHDMGYVDPKRFEEVIEKIRTVNKVLNGMIRTLKRKYLQ